MRSICKFFYSCFLARLVKLFGLSDGIVGAAQFRDELKTSDTLFLLGPGASILAYSERDFEKISKYNSVAINFFSIHNFDATFYLLEPHDPKQLYFTTKQQRYLDGKVLYKGYSSPVSFLTTLKNLVDARAHNVRLRFLKESGLHSIKETHSFVIPTGDMFELGGNSLLYMIMMAIKVGYRQVVLCGFDMDGNYFYCDPDAHRVYREKAFERQLCAVTHNLASDALGQKALVKSIKELVFIGQKRNPDFNVMVYKGRGILADELEHAVSD